jgi:hypothetical protein
MVRAPMKYVGKGSVVMHQDPEDHRTPDGEEEYHDPDELGPLGEPSSEETPLGIFVLLAFFLIALVVMWALVYFQLWIRG